MKYRVKFTTAYKKGYKRAKKRGLNMDLLNEVVDKLRNGKNSMQNIMTMLCMGTLRASASVISSRIGC